MMKRYQEERKALGSQALLTLVLDEVTEPQPLFAKLWQLIDSFEASFSRFNEASETSRFNHKAGGYASVSDEFKDLLIACVSFSEETGGLFNPFILPNLQREGYVGSWPTPANYKDAVDYRDRLSLPGISKMKINGNKVRIPINSAIDFGGIGKGYLLDQLASYLDAKGQTRYWLSLGGDIICNGFDVDDQPWFVKIQHATKSDELVGAINNAGAKLAIATSGITKRKGKDWHHIIDPRTGESAETDVLSVTVVALSAATADVYAKCLVVLGSKEADDFVKRHSIKNAYIQTRSSKVYCFGKRVQTP
jgi:thiamine biosynthesis lipoprotein